MPAKTTAMTSHGVSAARACALAACATAIITPSTAAAGPCDSRDNAAIHQYCEDVAAPRHDDSASSRRSPGAPGLSAAKRRDLASRGTDGRGVLALVEKGGAASDTGAPKPASALRRAKDANHRDGPATRAVRRAEAEPAVKRHGVLTVVGASAAVDGGGTLWWMLGGTAILLLLAAVQQRRRG